MIAVYDAKNYKTINEKDTIIQHFLIENLLEKGFDIMILKPQSSGFFDSFNVCKLKNSQKLGIRN